MGGMDGWVEKKERVEKNSTLMCVCVCVCVCGCVCVCVCGGGGIHSKVILVT